MGELKSGMLKKAMVTGITFNEVRARIGDPPPGAVSKLAAAFEDPHAAALFLGWVERPDEPSPAAFVAWHMRAMKAAE